MALRPLYAPLRPDLDNFLFAAVGEERNGVPLSVISALTRLGLDPWEEAGRLSSLGKRDAVDRLLHLIGQLPGARWPSAEARDIAAGLIERLPAGGGAARSAAAPQPVGAWLTRERVFWLLLLVLGAGAIVSIIARSGFPFGS